MREENNLKIDLGGGVVGWVMMWKGEEEELKLKALILF